MTTTSLYEKIPPAFQGYATLMKWDLSNEGMMVRVSLKAGSDVHPFRRYKVGINGGQRMHVALSRPLPSGENETLGAWEAMLAWWSDDPRSGMKVHIRLDDGPDGAVRHPLEGRQKGDEIYLACWLVDDSDDVVSPALPPKPAKARGWNTLKPAQQAHVLCRDPVFAEWCAIIASENNIPLPIRTGEDEPKNDERLCVAVVRARCGIVSRSEFSTDNEHGLGARRAWQEMSEHFHRWRG